MKLPSLGWNPGSAIFVRVESLRLSSSLYKMRISASEGCLARSMASVNVSSYYYQIPLYRFFKKKKETSRENENAETLGLQRISIKPIWQHRFREYS